LVLVSADADELAGSGGASLVDALRQANDEMLAAIDAEVAERCSTDELAGAYAQFIEEWCGKEDVDAHLVRFFLKQI
jgi:hypothetical protein